MRFIDFIRVVGEFIVGGYGGSFRLVRESWGCIRGFGYLMVIGLILVINEVWLL